MADGSERQADAIVSASRLRGSRERDNHYRSSHRFDTMSNTFLAGIFIGLLLGGFIATLAVALVAAASERSPRAPGDRRKTARRRADIR
jgi:hypothetical protein